MHFSFIQQVVQTVSLFLVSWQKYYMNLRCKHIYILSFENFSVLFPHDSQDWSRVYLSKMFQQCSIVCFYEYANKCSLEDKKIPFLPPFQVHTFQATMGFYLVIC